MNRSLIMTIVIVIFVGAASFFAGVKYQENKSLTRFGDRFPVRGNTQRFSQGGTRPVTGEVISVNEKGVTVKIQDGSSKIVLISSSTQINKASQATKEDIKTGETIMAFGTENSDGSIMAQNIQLGTMLRLQDARLTP